MVKEVMYVTRKLQYTNSPANAKNVLEWVRRNMITGNVSYKEALEKCSFFDTDIISKQDEKYPIFEKELGEILQQQSYDEQLLLICELICCLE